MKSFKSILKVSAVAVAAVVMSGSLTSCDVVAESMLEAALYPDYVVTRDVYHYTTYDHGYHRDYGHSYHAAPRHSSRTTVVSYRR